MVIKDIIIQAFYCVNYTCSYYCIERVFSITCSFMVYRISSAMEGDYSRDLKRLEHNELPSSTIVYETRDVVKMLL